MAYNTIKLKKYTDIIKEFDANAAITPGNLVELLPTNKVRKHATASGDAFPLFALEDELQGNGIDDNYAANDKVQVWFATPGEEVYAILSDGETASIGSFLESNGDGTLKVYTAESWTSADAQAANTVYSNRIVAISLENKDLAASSGEDSALQSSVSPLGYDKRIRVLVV